MIIKAQYQNKAFGILFLATVWIVLASLPGHADVVGRLHITVKNVDTEKPLEGAKITVHDTAGVRADNTLSTAADGTVTTGLLENHTFGLIAQAPGFETDTRQIAVVSDTTTDVEILLEPVEKTIKITGNKNLTQPRTTASTTLLNRLHIEDSPSLNKNPQQLDGLLVTTPGFALDSNNQAHPRGEHTQTSLYIDGTPLGGGLVGRFGPLVVPEALQSVDVMMGGFSPEYGSETAAILNTTVRSGPIDPVYGLTLGAGSYGARQGSVILGGQLGSGIGPKDADGKQEKKFSYFINGTFRDTDNALEPPQPDDQTAHNHGSAQSLLGRFDYTPNDKDKISLILDNATGNTQVANRTGLPDSFAPYGQGYGFGGALTKEEAEAEGILSQEDAGQDINQRDNNSFDIAEWRHTFSDRLSSLVSIGLQHSTLDVTNNNPAVNLANLPADNSIEYNPTVSRQADHTLLNGSLTYSLEKHTFKAGVLFDQQRGQETYQLTPASQLAAEALDGSPLAPIPNGSGGYSSAPVVSVNRQGHYGAAYVQDTWKMSDKLTANYGLRLDNYQVDETTDGSKQSYSRTVLSPRLNLAYSIKPGLVARVSYNKLFNQPPLSEGEQVGEFIKPELINQYDASIEKQIGSNQTVKLGYYYKDISNQLDIALLVPGSQMGIYSAVNLARAAVHGVELSYSLQPRGGVGFGGFVAYAYSTAKFNDDDGNGWDYNDHDQRNTLSTGINYTFRSKAFAAINYYYGSGLASSAYVEDGPRHSRSRVDMTLSTGPRLFHGKGGLRLDVDNLFDNRDIVNFNSDFSGTRFQQGRSIMVSTFLNF